MTPEQIRIMIERILNANPDEERQENICIICNGSGEGMWDGSTCSSCKPNNYGNRN